MYVGMTRATDLMRIPLPAKESFFPPFILDIVKCLVLVSTDVSRHPQIFEKVSYPLHRKDLVEVSYPTFIVKTAISVMNYQL
jgi:hypothetical protein